MKKNPPVIEPIRIFYFLLLSFLFLPFSTIYATNFVVSNGNNAGAGSLRQAITDANAHAWYLFYQDHVCRRFIYRPEVYYRIK